MGSRSVTTRRLSRHPDTDDEAADQDRIVPPTAVEWAAIHSFTETRRGSIRCGNRIVATTGTTTVLVAIAV